MSDRLVRLREWEVAEPDARDAHGVRGVCLERDSDRALAAQLARAGLLEIAELKAGLRIGARAHVGRVQLGGVVITVEPKMSPGDLLDLLRYAYGLRNLSLFEAAPFATTGGLLQDLVVAQLLAEVRELLQRGLARRYVQRTERLSSPRGRIDIGAIATRYPLVDPSVQCRHHPRSADHHLNRVLRAALGLAEQVACDPALKFAVARIRAGLVDAVGPLRLDAVALRRAWDHVDRTTVSYTASLKLTEILYACSSLSLDGDAMTSLPGFLFDMNRFFQALVGRLLGEHLPRHDVRDERGLVGMMRYLPHLNPRKRRTPVPRPDFALLQRGRTVALIDAKYRDLWERELPRDMLSQLAIYAMSNPGSTSVSIFPTGSPGASEAVVEIRHPGGEAVLGRVALRPLVLPQLLAGLRGKGSPVGPLVRHLALGDHAESGSAA